MCDVHFAHLPQAFAGNVFTDTGMVTGLMALTQIIIVAIKLTEKSTL